MIVIWLVVIVLLVLFSGMFYLRSSPAIPRNCSQLLAELNFQYIGMLANVDDKINQWRDRVELINLNGKIAVVTGGNRGIGIRVVEKLLECKMVVVLGVRNVDQAKAALEQQIPNSTTTQDNRLHFENLDVGDVESVRCFASAVKQKFNKIHLLINNAGIMAPPLELTKDGFETQMAVNYLGHFLLTHLLLPELQAAGSFEEKSRIVNVTSCLHLAGNINFNDFFSITNYYPVAGYMNSKLAQVLFTRELQKHFRAREMNIQIFAVHPGIVNTDIIQHFKGKLSWLKRSIFKSAEEGSRSIVFAGISPKLAHCGGEYITNCTIYPCHKLTEDAAVCNKLFDYTCNLLAIESFWQLKQ